MSTRETSFALITAWIHNNSHVSANLLPTTIRGLQDQILDCALLAAAAIRCWANEAHIPPEDLLATLAIGQALGELPEHKGS